MATLLYLTVFSIAGSYVAARNSHPYVAVAGSLLPAIYIAFLIFIYPFYFSPLRKLPEPKVSKISFIFRNGS